MILLNVLHFERRIWNRQRLVPRAWSPCRFSSRTLSPGCRCRSKCFLVWSQWLPTYFPNWNLHCTQARDRWMYTNTQDINVQCAERLAGLPNAGAERVLQGWDAIWVDPNFSVPFSKSLFFVVLQLEQLGSLVASVLSLPRRAEACESACTLTLTLSAWNCLRSWRDAELNSFTSSHLLTRLLSE